MRSSLLHHDSMGSPGFKAIVGLEKPIARSVHSVSTRSSHEKRMLEVQPVLPEMLAGRIHCALKVNRLMNIRRFLRQQASAATSRPMGIREKQIRRQRLTVISSLFSHGCSVHKKTRERETL